MKKQDLIIIVVLFALWIAWPTIDRKIVKKYFPGEDPVPAEQTDAGTPVPPGEGGEAAMPASEEPESGMEPASAVPQAVETDVDVDVEEADAVPEQTAVLANEKVRVMLSSYGAALKSAEVMEYRETDEEDSGPVFLNFSPNAALVYEELPGFSDLRSFEMTADPESRTVRFERRLESGLKLVRHITLSEHYLVKVTDTISNDGPEPASIGAHRIRTGEMDNLDGEPMRGMVYLGVDTLALGGEGVKHWGKKITKWFKKEREEEGLPKLPVVLSWPLEDPVDWAAAKNKYFVQILTPEGGGDEAIVFSRREVLAEELRDPAYRPKSAVPQSVWASIVLPSYVIEPGESFTRNFDYYIGPKKYSELKLYGMHQVDVMEFGMWAPIGKILLKVLNWIHDHIWPHNYGLAIMLLTIIIRIVFWPVTHKSTESMKRMQEIQPLVKEVREKYKDNAQKQQQEIMALYKEHKVNPLGGCLPMLIQIPVFIALFVVLRSAIELRFASFLWIRDLSQPENLLAGVLPIPLNILPLVMAGTMVWQQRLTPTAGDPNQRKMMMFMPVMMLVIFYRFASGLVLYWTTNQCLMITQQLLMRRKQKAKAAA